MSQDKNQPPEVPKKIVAVTALLLSACAAVYAFWIFNEIEHRMANRQTQNSQFSKKPNTARASLQDAEKWTASDLYLNKIEEEIVEEIADGFTDDDKSAEISNIAHFEKPSEPRGGQSGRLPKQDAQNAKFGLPHTVNNGSTDKKLIALTFDGGSNANAADDILDTLASRGVKSTMFLTGSFIKRFPQTVERIAALGHELANHTMTHPHLTAYSDTKRHTTRPEISRQTVIDELHGAQRLLTERTGLSFAPQWRSPYGEHNREICGWALDAGYLHIGWKTGRTWMENLDSNDWVTDENSPAFKTPDEVFYKIINMARQPLGVNGGITLMHLGTERKERSMQTHLILGRVIDTLREMGYETVTVSELLNQSEIDISGLASQKEQLTYGN
jgi:peptidoglycan/xylan/chitin deacetylase (PgdA/CDA1 family)